MNRGRHKKNKKRRQYLRSELIELLRTSDPSTYKARIYITSNPEREEP